jgi:anti-sigma B factor antagonist
MDVASVASIRRHWSQVMDATDPDRVIVDMRDVTFVDSTGLGALVGLRKQMLVRGGVVQVRGASLRVQQILTITGLHETFPDASAAAPLSDDRDRCL